jgi:hypothetical protein
MRVRIANKETYAKTVRRVDCRLTVYSNNSLYGTVTVWTQDGKVHNHNGEHPLLKFVKNYGFVITNEK